MIFIKSIVLTIIFLLIILVNSIFLLKKLKNNDRLKQKVYRALRIAIIIFFLLLFFLFIELFIFSEKIYLKEYFIVLYVYLLYFLGILNNYYFIDKRECRIKKGIEKPLTNTRLSENSIVKCDNHHRFIFFDCNYVGLPTTKIPKIIPLIIFYFGGMGIGYENVLSSIVDFPGKWQAYKMKKHYFCPKCGKEMFDKNLFRKDSSEINVQPILYKIFCIIALISLLGIIFGIIELIRLRQNIWFSLEIFFGLFGLLIVSVFIILIAKK